MPTNPITKITIDHNVLALALMRARKFTNDYTESILYPVDFNRWSLITYFAGRGLVQDVKISKATHFYEPLLVPNDLINHLPTNDAPIILSQYADRVESCGQSWPSNQTELHRYATAILPMINRRDLPTIETSIISPEFIKALHGAADFAYEAGRADLYFYRNCLWINNGWMSYCYESEASLPNAHLDLQTARYLFEGAPLSAWSVRHYNNSQSYLSDGTKQQNWLPANAIRFSQDDQSVWLIQCKENYSDLRFHMADNSAYRTDRSAVITGGHPDKLRAVVGRIDCTNYRRPAPLVKFIADSGLRLQVVDQPTERIGEFTREPLPGSCCVYAEQLNDALRLLQGDFYTLTWDHRLLSIQGGAVTITLPSIEE